MTVTESYQVPIHKGPDEFTKRGHRADRIVQSAEVKRHKEREQLLGKITLLDMSKQDGLARYTELFLGNGETGKAPMVFTQPNEVVDDPMVVALGENDAKFSGKNIIAVKDDAKLTAEEVKQVLGSYPDGATIMAKDSSLQVNYSDYEGMLGPHDAVVVMHEKPQVSQQEQSQN